MWIFTGQKKDPWLVDFYISNPALNLENSWRLLESIWIMCTGVGSLQTHRSLRNLLILVYSPFFRQFCLNLLKYPLWLPVTIFSQDCQLSRQDQPRSLTTALLFCLASVPRAWLLVSSLQSWHLLFEQDLVQLDKYKSEPAGCTLCPTRCYGSLWGEMDKIGK